MLLARIAAGEGMGLLPASFAAIRRDGVTFAPLEGAAFHLWLGLVVPPDKTPLAQTLAAVAAAMPFVRRPAAFVATASSDPERRRQDIRMATVLAAALLLTLANALGRMGALA